MTVNMLTVNFTVNACGSFVHTSLCVRATGRMMLEPEVDWADTSCDCSKIASRWSSLSHLRAAGDCMVEVAASCDGYLEGSVESHETIHMTFGDLLDCVQQGEHSEWQRRKSRVHLHLAQCPVESLPALSPDVQPPRPVIDAAGGAAAVRTNLWFCLGSGYSAAHYDCYSNLLMVLRGVKDILLLPPSATRLLRPRAAHGLSSNRSSLSRESLANTLADLEARGVAVRHSVGAGQTIFIPEGWWHAVESPDEVTIAVNFWWHTLSTGPAAERSLMARGLSQRSEEDEAAVQLPTMADPQQYTLRRTFERAALDEQQRLAFHAAGLEVSSSATLKFSMPLSRAPGCLGACHVQSPGCVGACRNQIHCAEQHTAREGSSAPMVKENAHEDATVPSRVGPLASSSILMARLVAATEDRGKLVEAFGAGVEVPGCTDELDRPELLRLLLQSPAHDLLSALALCAVRQPVHVRALLTSRLGPAGAHVLGRKLQDALSSSCGRCTARATERIESFLSVLGDEAARKAHRERLLALERAFADTAARNVLRDVLGLSALVHDEAQEQEAGGGGQRADWRGVNQNQEGNVHATTSTKRPRSEE